MAVAEHAFKKSGEKTIAPQVHYHLPNIDWTDCKENDVTYHYYSGMKVFENPQLT